jgi:4'-phosphopantetheinyl transferase
MAARLDIWTVNLRAVSADPAILSDEERERRFRTGDLRRRHLAACTALRHTLAFYAGMTPGDLFFGRDRFGKPFLKGRPDIAFSLAHAGEAAVLAVCEGPGIAPAIGVDIKPLTAPPDQRGQIHLIWIKGVRYT